MDDVEVDVVGEAVGSELSSDGLEVGAAAALAFDVGDGSGVIQAEEDGAAG